MFASRRLAVLVALGSATLAAGPVLAEERIALVIGNSGYEGGVLRNPVNDARLVGEKLEAVGFDVRVLTDANENEMERAIVDFTVALQDAGRDAVGLFYFAGHGIQSGGENYLIPIGHDIQRRADLGVESIRVNWVLQQLDDVGNRVNFIILDACRNNPLPESIFRATGTGLATLDAPVGTFIGYSTAPGTVAEDGAGDANSPYAKAFADNIETPNLPAELFFKRVRDAVIADSNGVQVPWDASSLAGDDFYFLSTTETTETTAPDGTVTTSSTTTTAVAAPPDGAGGDRIELAFWDSIVDSTDAGLFDAYLERYPDGVFSPIARSRLATLRPGDTAGAAPAAPVEPATPAAVIPETDPDLPAATYTVDAGGGGDFATIQAAIDAAVDGDVIHVMPGTYVEDVRFYDEERVTLIGLSTGESRPRIQPGEFRPIYVAAGDPTIDNFIIESELMDYAAVWAPGGRPKLRRNTIRSTANSCIWAEGSGAPIVQDNDIGPCGDYGVRIMQQGGGIYEGNTFSQVGMNAAYLSDDATASFLNNTIGRTGESAIWIEGNSTPSFINNSIQPGSKAGMEVFGYASPTVRENEFRGGLQGIVVGGDATGTFEMNDISRTEQQGFIAYENASPAVIANAFHDVASNCLHVADTASGYYESNTFRGCGVPPTYSAVTIGPEANPSFIGNTLEGPGFPDIYNENLKLDVSQNDVRP